jgi:hypothetical protein
VARAEIRSQELELKSFLEDGKRAPVGRRGSKEESGAIGHQTLNMDRGCEEWRKKPVCDIGTAAMSRTHIGRVELRASQPGRGMKAMLAIGRPERGGRERPGGHWLALILKGGFH